MTDTALATTPDTLQIGDRRWPFPGIVEASTIYRETIEALDLGSSQTPPCLLVAGGKTVGHVSYNGKVWAGAPRDWQPGAKPIFNPFE